MTDLTPAEREKIADVITGHPIVVDYYATSVGVDDARDMTDALAPVIVAMYADWLRDGRLPEGWERSEEWGNERMGRIALTGACKLDLMEVAPRKSTSWTPECRPDKVEYNQSGAGSAVNTRRRLTRSLDHSKEGLAMLVAVTGTGDSAWGASMAPPSSTPRTVPDGNCCSAALARCSSTTSAAIEDACGGTRRCRPCRAERERERSRRRAAARRAS